MRFSNKSKGVAGTAYSGQKPSKPTMRLGPTLAQRPALEKHRRVSCSKCKVEFSGLQVIKINDKQLCIWCAGHPGIAPTKSFTVGGPRR
jgi:hypothetical protein